MLSSFRERHPLGSIVTDLLRVEEGIYLVKAQISLSGIVLGSGIAGSTTVEEAEDAAIHRALRISGLDGSLALSMLGKSNGIGASTLPTATISTDTPPEISTDSPFSSVDEWTTPPPVPEPAVSSTRQPKPLPQKSKAEPQPEPALEIEPEIEDLSELIAQTDVELTRIGWGPKEGRRFLKERFSKQSRQQLDESELREFLRELKQQPTKMLDAAEF